MEEPHWLSPTELHSWMSLARMMSTLQTALDAQLQRDAGLSYFEYMVLAALSDQPDHKMRMSDLAAFANGSVSRLSHVARRMEAQDLVRREPAPDDRRSVLTVLTDTGRRRLEAAAPGHVAAVRATVMDALTTDQVAALGAAAAAITGRLEPDGIC